MEAEGFKEGHQQTNKPTNQQINKPTNQQTTKIKVTAYFGAHRSKHL
jgi:hypothetical protein